jgi:hypothetical protein
VACLPVSRAYRFFPPYLYFILLVSAFFFL